MGLIHALGQAKITLSFPPARERQELAYQGKYAMISITNPTLARDHMSNLQTVYIKLRNDAEFKAAFQKDPKQALQDTGLELTPQELHMILEQNKGTDDGPLGGRINK